MDKPELANTVGRTFYTTPTGFLSDGHEAENSYLRVSEEQAILVGSLCDDGLHAPILDIDFSAEVVRLTNRRYAAIYFHKIIPFDKFLSFLEVLYRVGLVSGDFRKMAEWIIQPDSGLTSILEVEFPIQLIPSTTPRHYHLYLDRKISWEQYMLVLKSAYETGIINRGFYEMSIKNGQSMVLLPGKDRAETTIGPRVGT
ncbi:MAG: hypothetical protein UT43_C0009G0009 [Parcubacteria group bacterium GW2011_GWC1_39_29]|uniref:Uncharacterized protein n=1 Tax=Candidatus Yanofskybacteria bacterium GW2011_GWD1_39_16 TaxID=1619030 RepID=A0A837HSE0_9BACT|nr:MAG: hypothetical protein UT35_C0005G0007 [Candidatus Yanofskybacteria bacterium GW2011_GWD1_39_16]KKR15034.1 MAG: hypothetical protein UT43_C0009G0009 [Parcubacteria group bacterium GW2011_GWC1_39_29]